MYELTRINVFSSARFMSIFFTVLYFVLAIVSFFVDQKDFGQTNILITLVVGLVLASGVGAVIGAIAAGMYNWTAKHWGGMHLFFTYIPDEYARDVETSEDAGPRVPGEPMQVNAPQHSPTSKSAPPLAPSPELKQASEPAESRQPVKIEVQGGDYAAAQSIEQKADAVRKAVRDIHEKKDQQNPDLEKLL